MLKPIKIVVVKATPIIALSFIQKLNLLQVLSGEVLIPPAVQLEVLAGGQNKVGIAELGQASWIRVMPLKDPRRADLLSDLDRGEAEVIALAQEINADLVIIDERLARRHVKRLGLALTGVVGGLLKAKEQGFIQEIRPFLEQLRLNGIRLNDALIEEALTLAGENTPPH